MFFSIKSTCCAKSYKVQYSSRRYHKPATLVALQMYSIISISFHSHIDYGYSDFQIPSFHCTFLWTLFNTDQCRWEWFFEVRDETGQMAINERNRERRSSDFCQMLINTMYIPWNILPLQLENYYLLTTDKYGKESKNFIFQKFHSLPPPWSDTKQT